MPSLRLRPSAFRTVKPPLVTNRTIQPTQVAGFNQFFDDFDGTEAWQYGAGLDARLSSDLSAGVEASLRNLDVPINRFGDRIERESADESLYRAYLYWTPRAQWVMSAELQFEEFSSQTGQSGFFPTQVETWTTPLSVRYFSPLGFFGALTGTFIHQDVNREFGGSEGNDSSFLVDAGVGFRFPQRRGLASLQLRNILNSRLKYQDDNFRELREEPSFPRFIPERTILGYLTLNF